VDRFFGPPMFFIKSRCIFCFSSYELLLFYSSSAFCHDPDSHQAENELIRSSEKEKK